MGAKILSLAKTEEVDVIARRTPGHSDVRNQVGILFLDSWPNKEPHEVTFQPIHERLHNVILDVASISRTEDALVVVDADTGKRWRFEINALDWEGDDEDDEDDEDDGWDDTEL